MDRNSYKKTLYQLQKQVCCKRIQCFFLTEFEDTLNVKGTETIGLDTFELENKTWLR